MRRSFSILSWVLSLAGACLGARIATPVWSHVNGVMEHVLWSGAFFLAIFAGGFLGLQLSLALNRRYRVQRARRWLAAFLVSAVLVFAVGAGGQALFMLSREEVQVTSSSVDMVLLLDASGSMDSSGYNKPRTEAATQFVDALSEDHALQAVSFASTVLDSTGLLTLDGAGKQTLKDFISAIDSVGRTDFNAPLTLAMETLSTRARADSNKAILLLTDGEGTVSDSVVKSLVSSDIRVFSVRIDSSGSLSSEAKALVDLAEATGGFDTRLKPAADGSVDTAALLTAFQNAFQASAENKLLMNEELLICSERTTAYQFVIRLVTLVLCAVLFGTGYFAQLNLSALLRNAVSGAVLAVLITLLGGSVGLCILLACLLLAAAYVTLERNGGDTLDV